MADLLDLFLTSAHFLVAIRTNRTVIAVIPHNFRKCSFHSREIYCCWERGRGWIYITRHCIVSLKVKPDWNKPKFPGCLLASSPKIIIKKQIKIRTRASSAVGISSKANASGSMLSMLRGLRQACTLIIAKFQIQYNSCSCQCCCSSSLSLMSIYHVNRTKRANHLYINRLKL